ncbi:DrmE family protein [Candidatus Bathyarchaeota archaeon]|nr:DrmE family protein [Candidatus Bathyarchaeota archaeon]
MSKCSIITEQISGLAYCYQPVRLHAIGREALGLCAIACNSPRPTRLAIFYPAKPIDILSIAGIEALYQFCYGGLRRARKRVLLVANEGANNLRQTYMNLGLNDMKLSSGLFGLAMVGRHGQLKSLAAHRGRRVDDKLVISSHKLFPEMSEAQTIGCIVISPPGPFGFSKVRRVCDWASRSGIPCVIAFDILTSLKNLQLYLDQGFLVYGWKNEDIAQTLAKDFENQSRNPNPYSTPVSFLDSLKPLEYARKIEVIAGGEVSVIFAEIRKLLDLQSWSTTPWDLDWTTKATIRRVARESEKLTSPVSLYNRECYGSLWPRPLNKMVEAVMKLGERLDSEHLGEVRKAALLFKELVNILDSKSNPKFEATLQTVKEALVTHSTLLLVFSSQPDQRAFEVALERLRQPISSEILEKARIQFESFDTVVRASFSPTADRCVLTSYPPLKRTNEVYAKLKLAHDVTFLLYKQEAEDLAFYEAMAKAAQDLFFSPKMRREVVESIKSGTRIDYPKIPEVIVQTVSEPTAPHAVTREVDFLAALTQFELLEDFSPETFLAPVRPNPDKSGRLVLEGIVISFQEGGSIALRPSRPVTVYHEDGKVGVKKAKALRPGESLILVNHSARKSLNDLILERASRYPKFRMLDLLVRIWIRSLREGMRQVGDNPRKTLGKLRAKGSTIQTSMAIKFWVLGLIIGPRDFQDIQRIAEIYSKPELSKQFGSLCKAIAEFRGLRRSLLRGLKEQMVSGAEDSLAKLGISSDDFSDAIDFFTVTRVERKEEIPMEAFNQVVEHAT